MLINNLLADHFNKNKDLMYLLESKIDYNNSTKITIEKLKDILLIPKNEADFDLFFGRELKDFLSSLSNPTSIIDKPVVLIKLPKKQIYKLLKIFYYNFKNDSLNKVLLKNYKEDESYTICLANEEMLFLNLKYKKDQETVETIIIDDELVNKRINVHNMNTIDGILKKQPEIINLNNVRLTLEKDNSILDLEVAKESLRKLNNDSSVLLVGNTFNNIPLMKELIEWGYEYKNFDFSIQTDGQILDRKFIKKYMQDVTLYLELDGPEHTHDLNRSVGSWKKATEFYKAYCEETNRLPITISTIRKNTVEKLFEHYVWFHELTKNTKERINHFVKYEPSNFDENDFVVLENEFEKIKNWYQKEKIYESSFTIPSFKLASIQPGVNPQIQELQDKFFYSNDNSLIISINGELISFSEEIGSILKKFRDEFEDYDGVDYVPFKKAEVFHCENCENLFCPVHFNDIGFLTIWNNKPENWCRVGKLIIKKSLK